MNKLFVIYLLLVSCNSANYSPEACYSCNYEHEFAITNDTLCLSNIDGNYIIYRYSGVLINASGKEKYITELWKLRLHRNEFTEIRIGRTFIWNHEKHSLAFGNRVYVSNK